MRNVFEHPELVNWKGVGLVVGASVILWTGLVTVVPENLHHIVIVVLATLHTTITFLMNSTKAPAPQPAPPEDKKEQP